MLYFDVRHNAFAPVMIILDSPKLTSMKLKPKSKRTGYLLFVHDVHDVDTLQMSGLLQIVRAISTAVAHRLSPLLPLCCQ